MNARPLVIVTLAFAAGIAAGYYSSWPLGLLGLVVALAGVVLVLGWVLWLDGRGASSKDNGPAERNGGLGAADLGLFGGPVGPILLMVLFFFLGAVWARLEVAQKRSTLLDDLNTHLDLIGRVAEEPRLYKNRTVYVLETWEVRQGDWREAVREKVEVNVYRPRGKARVGKGGGASATGTLGVTSQDRSAGAGFPLYRYGDVLVVHGRLELPPSARNPGEFDYRVYLARRGIFTRMAVEPEDVRLLGHRPANPLLALVYAAKTRALAAIESALPSREAGMLAAVVFGDQERLEEEDVEVYRSLGVYHVFAVSGQQVGFVLLLALGLSRLFRAGHRGRLAAGVAFTLFYMALTGFSPSVSRAGVMAVTGLVAASIGERPDPYTALSCAALAVLVGRPYELLEPGFQLSFLATWGIVYLTRPLEPLFPPALRRWGCLPALLAAQLAVSWLVAYYFSLVSPGFFLANLIVLPMVAAVTILGLLVLLAAVFWPLLGVPLASAAGGVLYASSEVLDALAALKGMVLPVARPPLWALPAYLAGLIAVGEAWRLPAARRGLVLAGTAVVLLGSVAAGEIVSRGFGGLEVVFLDVGQGDATYIKTPAGRNILIDGGGSPAWHAEPFDVGKNVVVPYLLRRGAHRLDLVISTHPDADHLEGLFSVIEKIPTGLVITPPLIYFGNDYQEFLTLLAQKRIPHQEVYRGFSLKLDPHLEVEVIHPPGPYDRVTFSSGSSDNNYSLVVKLALGGVSFLFPGDLEAEGMEELLRVEPKGRLRSTVFKVPHHGSARGLNTSFLEAVAPEVAVIQVGARNNFGHPAPPLLEFWKDQGVPVFRTDRHGAVTVRARDTQYEVSGFLSTSGF